MVDVKLELELLRQKLLDLSLNNNLLNYSPSKKRTVEIQNENISEIYDILVVQEKTMRFKADPKAVKKITAKNAAGAKSENADTEDTSVGNASTANAGAGNASAGNADAGNADTGNADADDEEESGFWKGLLKKKEDSSAVMLNTPYHMDELEDRLFHANNQAISIFEEQGYPILYLAVGFLKWTDGTKKFFKAPLILIPVEFKRVGPKRRFTVKWTGDDIFASITLKAKLIDFDLELPEFTGADDKNAVDFYIKAVEDLISDKKDWEVTRDANVDFYNFKKFVMYKDLDPKMWPQGHGPETHPLINHVFNPSDESYDGGFSENEVDLKLNTEEVYHVVNADSSQISVIEDVKAGKNLVVEGPPGTGKSQTITNLIAELLMTGKSVLFVSEKMAALQVVKKRLDTIGLGDMCLEIHSHKAQKKAVLDELERTLKRQQPVEKNYAQDLAELENLKYELNEYAKTLSQQVGPIGYTIYDIYGIREDVRHDFAIKKRKMAHAEFKNPEKWDRKQWTEAVSILEKMGDAVTGIGGVKENPWRDVRPGIILPPDLLEIETFLDDSFSRAKRISESVDVIVKETGIKAPDSLNELDKITNQIGVLQNAPKISRNVLKNQSIKERNAQKELMTKAKKYRQLEEEVEEIFTSKIFDEDIDTYLKKSGNFFKFMDSSFTEAKESILNCYIQRTEKSNAQIKKDVLKVRDIKNLDREFENANLKAAALFGPLWEEGRNDPKILEAFYDWAVLFDGLESGGFVTEETYTCIENGINGSALAAAAENIEREKNELAVSLIRLANSIGADPDLFFNEKSVKEIKTEDGAPKSVPPASAGRASHAATAPAASSATASSAGAASATSSSSAPAGAAAASASSAGSAEISEPDEPEDTVQVIKKRKYELTATEKVYRDTLSAKQLNNILHVWKNELPALVLWSQFLLYREKCLETVAAPMVPLINENEVLPEDLIPAFKGNYADGVLRAEFTKKRVLSTFIKEVHENKIHKFEDLDNKVIVKNRDRVNIEIYKRMPQIYIGASRESEAGILLNEFNKKKAHMPIRRLMSNAGGLIQRIKPCFMMSSLSIAQYLEPRNMSFDVVIFDEASQVRPEDALGALLRGRQAVVMGDSKQLPPTTFFENLLESDDEYNEDASFYSDVESVLNICKRSFPYRTLRWHYRSRHESLIAVSNNEFYGNHLYVYPSPRHEDRQMGLQFRPVKDSVYERGKTGVNKEEARIVAQEVMRHFIQFPEKTLMVGTFNVKQQEAIQKEIESLIKSSPGFEKFFANDKGENFMVKNIETIQGDERDVIFVSIGFGFDQNGKLSKNFGPLNRDGGERRLNVLFTRAREKCVIFSNFRAADLNVTDDDPAGLRVLKSFLEYAESKTFVSKTPEYVPDEITFEESVAAFLREECYIVHPKIGCAGYKMDMAIVNEKVPGHYIIGIETDGPQYFKSRVARDRDRLRRDVLTGLGWQLYRVWSTDWYLNPQKSKKGLLDAIEKAKETAQTIEAPVNFEFDDEDATVTVTGEKDAEQMMRIIIEKEAECCRIKKEKAEKERREAEALAGGTASGDTEFSEEPDFSEEAWRRNEENEEQPEEEMWRPKEETVTEPKPAGKITKAKPAGKTTRPAKTEPAGTEPTGTESTETESAETEPSKTDPSETDPTEEVIEYRPKKERAPSKSKSFVNKLFKGAGSDEDSGSAHDGNMGKKVSDEDELENDDMGDDDLEDDIFSDVKKMPADMTDEQMFDVEPLIRDGVPEFKPYAGIDLPSTENLLEIPRHKMEHEIVEIISHEGPIHKEHLILEIKMHCDTKRLTKAMRDMIIREVSSAEKSNYIRVRGNFLWPPKLKGCIVRKREGDLLNIEWISDEEILQAAIYVLKTQYSTPQDQLAKRIVQVFGFKIMRPPVKERVTAVIGKALSDDKLIQLPNGKIYLHE
ncbi:MAG: DUF4011 domain-containing protein [Methanimicrococcus sp.]|nr:DUF4011 domain-containing protein [Methanimicrococcus sp.]